MRQRKFLFGVLPLLLLFAACKGESPTSPSTTPVTGTQPTGGAPPTGATVVLSVSNANPLVSSTSVITATVSQNGQPVPNGTAVQFTSTLGTFTDVGASGSTVIKTTTNGVATATLTSSSPGTATVRAIVNNVTQSTTVTFRAAPVTPPTPTTAPTISSIAPTTAGPEGGTTIRINGTNFRQPLRVIFRCEGSAATPPDPAACNGQLEKDAFIVSVTSTQIVALTPQFNVAAGQAITFSVTVITGAGTTGEQSVSQAAGFTFTSPSLTPSITTISPLSGPLEGGTRISIIGTGFQAPVQVTFGTDGAAGVPLTNQVELQVISINFTEIVAMTPEYRLIDPTLILLSNGQVAVRVVNVNSGTDDVQNGAFRYLPRIQITNVEPTSSSAIGGGQIRIDGIGFDDPVAVSVAGVAAQPIRVSGTEVVVRLGATPSPCVGGSGPVVVTNVNTGDTAASTQIFTYLPVNPTITSVTGTPPGTITVSVLNPGVGPLGTASVQFTVGTTIVTPTPSVITAGTGTQTFTFVVPSSVIFPTVSCTNPLFPGFTGTQFGPLNLVFNNLTTACTATLTGAIPPPAPNSCVFATATVTSPPPACPNLTPASVVAAGAVTHAATITIMNAAGSPPLILGPPTVTSTTNATAVVAPTTGATVNGGASTSYTVTLDPTAAGADSATITFTSNDPTQPTINVIVCGSGT